MPSSRLLKSGLLTAPSFLSRSRSGSASSRESASSSTSGSPITNTPRGTIDFSVTENGDVDVVIQPPPQRAKDLKHILGALKGVIAGKRKFQREDLGSSSIFGYELKEEHDTWEEASAAATSVGGPKPHHERFQASMTTQRLFKPPREEFGWDHGGTLQPITEPEVTTQAAAVQEESLDEGDIVPQRKHLAEEASIWGAEVRDQNEITMGKRCETELRFVPEESSVWETAVGDLQNSVRRMMPEVGPEAALNDDDPWGRSSGECEHTLERGTVYANPKLDGSEFENPW